MSSQLLMINHETCSSLFNILIRIPWYFSDCRVDYIWLFLIIGTLTIDKFKHVEQSGLAHFSNAILCVVDDLPQMQRTGLTSTSQWLELTISHCPLKKQKWELKISNNLSNNWEAGWPNGLCNGFRVKCSGYKHYVFG